MPAPVAEAAPAPVATSPAVDISADLEQAGLVMIETAADKNKPAPTFAAPEVPLGRKPKAVQEVAAEPLQMVETRRE
jgi:hypothetical protein